jgi:hypothetical protein
MTFPSMHADEAAKLKHVSTAELSARVPRVSVLVTAPSDAEYHRVEAKKWRQKKRHAFYDDARRHTGTP